MAKITKALKAVETEIETVWVEITEPVKLDGERLAIGALIEIEKLAAEALKRLGAAKDATPPAAPAA